MNDQRYRCSVHPDTTIGATPGETEPPACMTCGRSMRIIKPDDSRVQHVQADPRRLLPGRPEARPL